MIHKKHNRIVKIKSHIKFGGGKMKALIVLLLTSFIFMSCQNDTSTMLNGRQFFDEHMEYLGRGDIDGMIDDQYTEDAVLISPFDILDTPPPHIVRGREALKEFFKKYTSWQGSINVESLYVFAETKDAISFQAIFTSNTGRWLVGDAWSMREGKIAYHFSFAHRLGDV